MGNRHLFYFILISNQYAWVILSFVKIDKGHFRQEGNGQVSRSNTKRCVLQAH
jgi:hypothetical protein